MKQYIIRFAFRYEENVGRVEVLHVDVIDGFENLHGGRNRIKILLIISSFLPII